MISSNVFRAAQTLVFAELLSHTILCTFIEQPAWHMINNNKKIKNGCFLNWKKLKIN